MFLGVYNPWYEGLIAASVALTTAVSLVYGREPERIAGGGGLVTFMGNLAFHRGSDYSQPLVGTIVTDGGYVALCIVLVLRYRRRWLVPFTALQLLSAAPPWVMLFDVHLGAFAALSVASLWAYLASAVLLLGVWLEAVPEATGEGAMPPQ